MPLRRLRLSRFLQARPTRTIIAFALWATLLAGGFHQIIKYEVTAGHAGEPPKEWPVEAPVKFDATRSNLVMFAHPMCPCTRASVSELIKVLTRANGAIKATVLFYVPREESGWEQEKLWRTVAAIPGVDVVADPDGIWAKRFGAETSGHTVLFDQGGRLVFRGGITGTRGHEGDNTGEEAIVALALTRHASTDCTSVFGCSLSAPTPDLAENP